MLILVSYDVSTISPAGRKRLRRVAKFCKNYGQRVQNSVFECNLDFSQFAVFKNDLIKEISTSEDSLRFYTLGNNWRGHVEHIGAKPSIDFEGPLIV